MTYIMHRGHPTTIIDASGLFDCLCSPSSDDTHELGGDVVPPDDDDVEERCGEFLLLLFLPS
jgi:hypothetical protein